MLSDIEIAQAAKMQPITEIAARLGLQGQDVIPYGHYKAKIDHRLAEAGPVQRRILDHQSCHAGGRSGGEQRVKKRRPLSVPGGDRQCQQQSPCQDQQGKADQDDPGRRHVMFRGKEHSIPLCHASDRQAYYSTIRPTCPPKVRSARSDPVKFPLCSLRTPPVPLSFRPLLFSPAMI